MHSTLKTRHRGRPRPAVVAALVALLLLTFGLRVMRLEVQSIWVDEGFSVDFASRTASDMTAMWKARGGVGAIDDPNAQRAANDPLAIAVDIHPPLYYLTLHEWLPLGGSGEFSVRFPSVIAGVLLVLALFKLGDALAGPALGLTAGAVGAVAPYYIAYSQEARMYGPVALFSAFSVYFWWLVIRRGLVGAGFKPARAPGQSDAKMASATGGQVLNPPLQNPASRMFSVDRAWLWPWLGLVLSSSLALYTHYSAVLVIVTENALAAAVALWLLAARRDGRRFAGWSVAWLTSQAIELLLFIPWLRTSIGQVAQYNENLWTPNWRVELNDTFRAFNVGLWVPEPSAERVLYFFAGVLVFGLAVSLLLSFRRTGPGRGTWNRQRTGLVFGVAVLAVETAVALAVFQVRPEFHPRYLMVLATPYYLLCGVALVGLWRLLRVSGLAAGLLLLAVSLYGLHGYQFDDNFAKDDTRTVAQYIASRTTADDVIVLDAPEPLDYYYHGPAKMFYIPGEEQTVAAELTKEAAGKKRVVYLQWFLSTSDPEQLMSFLLQKYGKVVDDHTFRGYRVRQFEIPPNANFDLGTLSPIPAVNFGGTFQLEKAGIGPAIGGRGSLIPTLDKPQTASGQQLMVGLQWKLLKPVAKDYKATAYLTDDVGHVAGQVDLLLYRGQATTRRWQVGDEATNYYVMQTVGGLMPGAYKLNVALYEGNGDERLSVLDAAGAPAGGSSVLGTVQILPPSSPVDLATLGISHPLANQAAPGINLEGYDLFKTQLLQGDPLPLTLFWGVSEAPASDLQTTISLKPEAGGGSGWSWTGPPKFATSQWRPGWSFRDWYQPLVAADLAPGSYQLSAGLGGVLTPLGTVQIVERQRSFATPTPQHAAKAQIGPSIELLGYDADKVFYVAGDTVHLTLYWQATGAMADSFTAFAHILDSGRHVAAQRDNIPVNGTLPTNTWAPGQIVTDQYNLPLDRSLAPGTYQLETGLYRGDTGVRLHATSADLKVIDDGVLLGPLVVK